MSAQPDAPGENPGKSPATTTNLMPPWSKGQTGNPGGRPKGLARKVREECGQDGDKLVSFLLAAVAGKVPDGVDQAGNERLVDVAVGERITAARILMERGWGKPPAFAPIEDDDPLDLAERAIDELAADFDLQIDELARRRKKPRSVRKTG